MFELQTEQFTEQSGELANIQAADLLIDVCAGMKKV